MTNGLTSDFNETVVPGKVDGFEFTLVTHQEVEQRTPVSNGILIRVYDFDKARPKVWACRESGGTQEYIGEKPMHDMDAALVAKAHKVLVALGGDPKPVDKILETARREKIKRAEARLRQFS